MALYWCKCKPPFSDYSLTLLLAKWMTFLKLHFEMAHGLYPSVLFHSSMKLSVLSNIYISFKPSTFVVSNNPLSSNSSVFFKLLLVVIFQLQVLASLISETVLDSPSATPYKLEDLTAKDSSSSQKAQMEEMEEGEGGTLNHIPTHTHRNHSVTFVTSNAVGYGRWMWINKSNFQR